MPIFFPLSTLFLRLISYCCHVTRLCHRLTLQHYTSLATKHRSATIYSYAVPYRFAHCPCSSTRHTTNSFIISQHCVICPQDTPPTVRYFSALRCLSAKHSSDESPLFNNATPLPICGFLHYISRLISMVRIS